MEIFSHKFYTTTLQISIVTLSLALAWFAFIYYPKVINQYKSGRVASKSIFKPVSADSKKFPIETTAYRLVYDDRSGTYYAFVEGAHIEEYVFNRDNAKLELKSALSLENLCNINVIYSSTQRIKIPRNLENTPDC